MEPSKRFLFTFNVAFIHSKFFNVTAAFVYTTSIFVEISVFICWRTKSSLASSPNMLLYFGHPVR